MNVVLLIIIGILLTVELGLWAFCEYWRENNIWKWFFIKTLTTILIVFYLVYDATTISHFELILSGFLGIGIGIDFAITYLEHKDRKKYEC